MTISLRPYQANLVGKAYNAWSDESIRAVLLVLATGGGKSYTLSQIVKDHLEVGHTVLVVAHRDVLCEQLSCSLATMGIHHGFIMSKQAVTDITNIHYQKFKESFFDDTDDVISRCAVVSIDTWAAWAKGDKLPEWVDNVTMVVIDEAHHVIQANKWGDMIEYIEEVNPDLRVLGCTATPERSDRKGLWRWNDGCFDTLVEADHEGERVTMGWLIENGSLSPYRLIVPLNANRVRLEAKNARITASGDFSAQVAEALVDRVTITGDVVETYKKWCGGCQGITFATTIAHAEKLAEAYRLGGVSAAAVSSKTKPALRRQILGEFRAGHILQLVNVGLFDEGFDVPGIVCVSMVAPTMSYGKYVQRFGRALRMMDGKTEAFIFDHTGDTTEHRLPDNGKAWTLDAPPRKNTQSDHANKTCGNADCQHTYELPAKECPKCGFKPAPPDTSGRPYDFNKAGEMIEMAPEDIAKLQRVRNKLEVPIEKFEQWAHQNNSPVVAFSMIKNHKAVKAAQTEMRVHLHNWWIRNDMNDAPDGLEQFASIFGMSVEKCLTLHPKEARKISERVLLLDT